MKAGLKLASLMGLSLVFCSTSKNGPPMPAQEQTPEAFINSLEEKWLGDQREDPKQLVLVSDRFEKLASEYRAIEEEIAVGLDQKSESEKERYRLFLALRVEADLKARNLFGFARNRLLTDQERKLLRDVPGRERLKVIRKLVSDERVEAVRGNR